MCKVCGYEHFLKKFQIYVTKSIQNKGYKHKIEFNAINGSKIKYIKNIASMMLYNVWLQ